MRVVLDENGILPTKAHNEDAGWDLYATEDFVVPGITTRVIAISDENGDLYYKAIVDRGAVIHDTGVHMEIPNGYAGLIKTKSGLASMGMCTDAGVIDSGYTGPIKVKIVNDNSEPYIFNKGDKIAQIVVLPIFTDDLEVVDELAPTERGDNGFGSSGK